MNILIASKRDEEGYVESALKLRMEEKITGMEDFKTSADFARTLNATLQEKMLEANQERAAALFTKDKCNELVQDLGLEETTKPKVNNAAHLIDKLDDKMMKDEISQMEKAIKVLMFEYDNRKRIRDKNKAVAGKVTKRVQAMMIFNSKKDTFSKIKQTQIDEIEAYQKKKIEYHKKQEELEKKREKEKEREKEEELEEKKKRESMSNSGLGLGRDKLDSTNSDDGNIFGGSRSNRRGRLQRLESANYDEDEDVFGGAPKRNPATGAQRTRNSYGSTSEDQLGRKNSTKEKEKPKKTKKVYGLEKGPDMSRAAQTVAGIFYWDRQQNQKTNSTNTGR